MLSTDWNQHHTNRVVAQTLTGLMEVSQPKSVIDLGVGQGSLLEGARHLWREANLHGVDIDAMQIAVARERIPHATFAQFDCLTQHNNEALQNLFQSADVVLCNPPFMESYEKASPMGPRRIAEIEFLKLSLRLLKPKGYLGIILPARYISGPSYRKFRNWLVCQHELISVTALPRNTFNSAQVDTFFLVVRNSAPINSKPRLQALLNTGTLSPAIRPSISELADRMDYFFYATKPFWEISAVPLAMLLTTDILRGFPSQGRKTPSWMFHTTDFKHHPNGLIRFEQPDATSHPCAQAGDILIPRVGSRCIQYAAFVKSGSGTFSDCVYRLRVAREWQAYVFHYLQSPLGIRMRQRIAHGSCVKILGKQALLDLLVPMNLSDKDFL